MVEDDSFDTELGCTIRLLPIEAVYPHFGSGALLLLEMRQEGDGRRTEVYLNQDNLRSLLHLIQGQLD